MKKAILKWTIRLGGTGLLIVGLMVSIVLNPSLLYANKTIIDNYTVFHNAPIDEELSTQLKNATQLLKASELYDVNFSLQICFNDGSYYPILIEKVRGQAFAWGFSNKVVLEGAANFKNNTLELNGYHWNLEQLITHEAIHCYQQKYFGFWKSNPIQ